MIGAALVFSGGLRPNLFGHEWHERMQQAQRLLKRPFGGRLHFGFGGDILALQGGFGKLNIPVAKAVPDKLIDAV